MNRDPLPFTEKRFNPSLEMACPGPVSRFPVNFVTALFCSFPDDPSTGT